MHKTTESFWKAYNRLPPQTQRIADKNFELLKENTKHPSLKFKKLGKFWSVRVGLNHRALAVEKDSIFYWHWIGSHAEYNQLVS